MTITQDKQETNTLIGNKVSKQYKPFPWLRGYHALLCTSQQDYPIGSVLLQTRQQLLQSFFRFQDLLEGLPYTRMIQLVGIIQ
jgi:hypothetical protein